MFINYLNTIFFYFVVDMGVFLSKCKGKIPTLNGIKFTHTDLEQGSRCLQENDRNFTVFLGADQVSSILTLIACLLNLLY